MNHERRLFSARAAAGLVAVAAASHGRAGTAAAAGLGPGAGASWPGYHGDASGRHHSALAQIHRGNIGRLGLAWAVRPGASRLAAVAGGLGAPAGGGSAPGFPAALKSIPVVVDDRLYLTLGAQVYALDARTGEVVWRHHWHSASGAQLGRGVAVAGDLVLVQTGSDNHLLALDRHSGRERWRQQVTDSPLGYSGSTAPVLAGGLVVLGMGGDGNNLRAWLEARDAATGALRWRWYVTPDADGQPGADTWPDAATARRAGGMPWQQVTYDAALNRVYVPTANPTPVFAGDLRPGDNLYTNCIVALDAHTGRPVWHFQTTPHDTHDYDGTQVPMLFDALVRGRRRQLLAQFNRNGHYFVLDRVTGEWLHTVPYVAGLNWSRGIDAQGRPIPDPAKDPQPGGSLVMPMSDGASNFPPSALSPRTGLAYVHANAAWSLFYRHPEEAQPLGWAGGSEYHLGLATSALVAVHAATGRPAWRHAYPGTGFLSSGYPGLLSTAGDLLFTGDPQGFFRAFDARNGRTLWHSRIGLVRNTPITCLLDGRQQVLVASDDTLYAFALNGEDA